ncbi:YhcN/YlaJ family sporulation lipoprotein [Maledivibacter halophilus]|uniref:Sporulation lipoprotein, YhcN/YlaJ family n=1 Tax=Maledivibacter halophilus TaxID=36842 RepID=A0A1T5M627_9FIRM|nr:YhcN/YlaJ family sporulation lipoprotein [Maledivibacter halophilus]SKC83329.1 sporulation lipoprotein, YhcN/YlaJ family [Maledivibacter halophilus]
MENNKLRMLILTLSLVLIVSAFIIGCTPQQRPTPEKYGTRYYMDNNRYNVGYDRTSPYNYGQGNLPDNRMYGFFDTGDNRRGIGYDNIPNNMMIPSRTAANSQEVKRMEDSCKDIKGVNDVTVVRNGETAYVGVDKDQGTNENLAALRTECANRIRKIDPSVNKVVVTVDSNKITRLKNMVRDMNIGTPARNFMNDLENLFR